MDPAAARHTPDDLEALADAVREAARTPRRRGLPPESGPGADPMEVARRGHLRILRSPEG
jgi:hypothetical protein